MLTELAAQFDLLAQGPNLEGWGDLLVIAIMAILWLAGALAKAISGRKGTQQQSQQRDAAKQPRQRETWQQRLARKAEELRRAAEAQGRQTGQGPHTRTQASRPRPAPSPPAGKITLRTGQKGDSVVVFERPSPYGSIEREQQAARQEDARKAIAAAGQQIARPSAFEPRIDTAGPDAEPIVEGIMVGAMREPATSLESGSLLSEATRQVGGFEPSAIIDYSDPDALKRAILHYEILGKPLAMRNLSEEESSLF